MMSIIYIVFLYFCYIFVIFLFMRIAKLKIVKIIKYFVQKFLRHTRIQRQASIEKDRQKTS